MSDYEVPPRPVTDEEFAELPIVDLDKILVPEEQRMAEWAATYYQLLYQAWTVIANVSEGDWFKQTDEWRKAAIRWRDAFHAALDAAPSNE